MEEQNEPNLNVGEESDLKSPLHKKSKTTIFDNAENHFKIPVELNDFILLFHNENERVKLPRASLELRYLDRLRGNNWLNDEVINEYFQLIQKRSESNLLLPKVKKIFNIYYY